MFIVIAIIAFGLLIAIHELGHFIAAKCCGVKVEEYSIGMGPALYKRRRGDTLYALRILPIGGYCAMAGENEESDDPAAFMNKSAWRKFIILFAGSFMNFLLGLLLILLMYSDAQGFVAPTIDKFMDNCPYESADALMAGDTFYSIDGKRVLLVTDVQSFLQSGDGVYDFVMLRDGEKVELKDFRFEPIQYEDGLKYGMYFGVTEASFGAKLDFTWATAKEFSRWVWMGLRQLTSGEVHIKDMSGPVGIVDMMNTAGKEAENTHDAAQNILYLSAFIAINLAIMNLLPIPALDGGRIFFLIVTAPIEAITHKKIDPKYEAYIHAAGMLLLLLLMAVVMYNDIFKLVAG